MSQTLLSPARRSLAASSALLLLGALITLLCSPAPVLAARLLQPTNQAELQPPINLASGTHCDLLAQAAAAAGVLSSRRNKSKESLGGAWQRKGGSLSLRSPKPYNPADGPVTARRSLQQLKMGPASEEDLGSSYVHRHDLADGLAENGTWAMGRCVLMQSDGLTKGDCCVLSTWGVISPPLLDGCTAIVQLMDERDLAPGQGLQTWLQTLPPGVVGLDLAQLNLTGPLPESFEPNTALEVLYLDDNHFTGTLPDKWSQLTKLRSLDLSNYEDTSEDNLSTVWGNNSFSGRLPEKWGSSLVSLEYFVCNGGACDMLEGSIPFTWDKLCNLKWLLFINGRDGWWNNKMSGKLPWLWMYKKPTDWKEFGANFSCIPDVVWVGGSIQLPQRLCLARGHAEIESEKFVAHNDGRWAAIVTKDDLTTGDLEALRVSTRFDMKLHVSGNLCISSHRFKIIGAVYGVFGFLALCAVVDLLWPKKASCCACLDPEGAKEAGEDVPLQQHPAIATAVPIAVAGSKLLLVMSDLASDILATWAIRETNFVWVFAAMLLVPKILAALVLHLRLCHITDHQDKWQLLFAPTTYRMYKSLYRRGGLALLHASIVFLWPYWVFLQVPILFGASFGRMIESCQRSKWGMQWLNLARFCSLLSLLMACTESPFSAVVFTYFYAHGMTAQFPTLIKDWNFVLTVFTALLHMVTEFWRMVPFIKAGRFKQRVRSLFLDVVVAKQAADGTVAVEKSVDVAGGMGTAAQQGNKSVEYYYPGEVPGVQSMGKTPVVVAVDEGGQVERPGLGGESADAGRRAAVAGEVDGTIEVAGDRKQQQGNGVVYYYPGEVPGFGGMSTSSDAAVVEEEEVARGVGGGPVGNAGRGAGRSAPPRAGRGTPPRAGQVAGRGAPPRAGRDAARGGECGSAE